MSNLQRKIQRQFNRERRLKKKGIEKCNCGIETEVDGMTRYLHYTKGWRIMRSQKSVVS